MPNDACAADKTLADIAAREWSFRRRHVVRELGAYVPLRGELPKADVPTQTEKSRFWTAILQDLAEIDGTALSDAGQEDLLVLRHQVEALLRSQQFRDYERPFNGFTSFWDDTAASIREETFDQEQKYRHAITLMRDIPRYFRENIENMRLGLMRGFSQPSVVLPAVIKTIEAVLAQHPVDTDYFKPFLAFPPQIPPGTRDELRNEALSAINDAVLPAFADLLDFMRAVYSPAATQRISAAQLPDGPRYYEVKVREFTTLEIGAEEVYDTGLREVETCRENMMAAMRATGFSGSFADFLSFLKSDPQFYAKSAEELLMRAAWITKKVEGKLDRFFGLLPRRRFAIERVPDAIAPAYPMGTGGPGLYLVNTYNLTARPLYILPVLTLHEAVPGHCFQMSLAAENKSRPAFRSETYGIAYGNAWALYCEKRLGVAMEIYETPYELFGMWSFLMLRAVRMVVDVGIHAKSWEYERASRYMAENTGLPAQVVGAELNRYISWPGQALGYYLGMIAIERARDTAEQVLGEDFDIREFHDRILALGPVPMSVVETTIDLWIREKQSLQIHLA
ncbi:DUF885 domain-containing protein [Microvirga lotononidis]|uniref:DUF885 domain-containing protein n=1 Tax=Microvirga lotononidis TaxID=864069 RepID=I4Z1B6_9HYPH|nr:DUF885 family protein [Microvirga lotononidis]EIM30008.1 hypothetical protein MicloDRAFT_00013290 [Microvirga lotononidis]WQO31942.1 DUF885 family protein [Microvirga lotononidis]